MDFDVQRHAKRFTPAAKRRAPRTAIATLVSVGFIVFAVGIRALPPTTRFSKPHTRENGSATETAGSVPARIVPM